MSKKKKPELIKHEVFIDGRKVDFIVRLIRQMCDNPQEAMAVLIACYMEVCENTSDNKMTQLEMADIAHRMITSMTDEFIPERSEMN